MLEMQDENFKTVYKQDVQTNMPHNCKEWKEKIGLLNKNLCAFSSLTKQQAFEIVNNIAIKNDPGIYTSKEYVSRLTKGASDAKEC